MTMKRFSFLSLLLIWISLLGAAQVEACTAFTMQTGAGWVTGRNYDWDTEPAWLLVNRRGTPRRGLLEGDPGPAASWVSRFGSLTVNQYGYGFPCSGMNEAGLSVDALWLDETRYPGPDTRPALTELQWIQYVLDQAATVDEALRLGSQVRITASSSPLHFYLADRQGNRAVLEFADGKAVVSKPADPQPFGITNSRWQASEKARLAQAGTPAPTSAGSLDRYCRALGFASETKGSALDTSTAATAVYAILQSVATERTVWQLVYEPQRGRFWYKSAHAPLVKYLDLNALDFTPTANLLGQPLVLPLSGDTRSELRPYEAEDNRNQLSYALKVLGDERYASDTAIRALSEFQMRSPALLPERHRVGKKAR